jgi:hypothetical protein
MAPITRAQRREYHAKPRHRRKYHARLQREHARAQRHLQALAQALVEVGVAKTVVAEVQWRLQAVRTRLGQIFGRMFPTVCGCRTHHERTRVRGWDKNLPSRILGALPTQKWLRQVPHRGQDLLATLWHHVEDNSPATRRRWPWTWVSDDRVVKKAGRPLGLVGTWYRGQDHRVRRGIDGVLLIVVVGEGKLVMPVDCTVRRPDPVGPGRPCRDQLPWRHVMVDRTWTAWQRLGLALPAPLVVADRWFGDSTWLAHVARHQRGTAVVGGKRTDVCRLPDGRRVTGQERLTPVDWPWRDRLPRLGRRYVRRTATSPTGGSVTVVIVNEPGQPRDDLRCQATPLPAPRLIRAWKRRSWIEHSFRTLKPLWATEACQVHEEDAYDGHLVWRLVAGLVRLSTARRLLKGCVTREEIVFSLKHHWRFLTSKDLE